MAFAECAREQEVLEMAAAGCWPDGGDAELRAHVARCGACTELAAVVAPLIDARDEAWRDARVPSSAIVWWRAQMRARREAVRSAVRPITVVQAAAGTLALMILSTLAGVIARWVGMPFAGLGAMFSIDLVALAGPLATSSAWRWAILLVIVPWLILAPLAIYFAVAED